MIATLATESAVVGETIATTRFAQRCAQLKNELVVNEAVDWKELSERLMEENRSLVIKINEQKNDEKINGEGDEKMLMLKAPSIVEPAFVGDVCIRDILNKFDVNLAKHPKETRKRILAELLDRGLDAKFGCVADLCVMAQVLIAKLEQTTEEKRQLKVEYIQSSKN